MNTDADVAANQQASSDKRVCLTSGWSLVVLLRRLWKESLFLHPVAAALDIAEMVIVI
ncbi:hypothetical protein M404DRAFT_995642 [Pisolithus tinctorius Marx 270]|uniref:Uncharacterized protein n=1 Tax=Pisolithus tinctorius Marx 270 TaxID=870435 RepID=A0A0C3PA39_PISTI|nr:hypothetical protein M404DRAFT_995642 [Pisolithus tinctorius Marx 270]